MLTCCTVREEKKMPRWRRLIPGLLLAAVVVDKALLRPYWYLNWGATGDERHKKWPGDELVEKPGYSTRAVTINASTESIWPWILQIGQDRGGFYSYTWLENLLLADMHNAGRIVPEYQSRKVGDVVWLAPERRYGGQAKMVVAQLVPNRAMVLVQADDFDKALRGEWVRGGVWQFLLEPIDSRSTRLIMRGAAPDKTSLLYDLMFDPAHFIMERKMMLGIKERAEREVLKKEGTRVPRF
jgi:hypothetical protein